MLRSPRSRTVGVLVGCALALALVPSCSSDESSSSTTEPVPAGPATDGVETDPPGSGPVETDEPSEPGIPWETVAGSEDCECSDGSEYEFHVREADPSKVVFFLEGGGACFDLEGCRPGSENYKPTVGDDYDWLESDGGGIFDFDNAENPFADHSMVYVPYCTADVHIGNVEQDYGDGVVIQHKGYVNGTTALAEMAERFPDATEIVVVGASAGSVVSPLYAGLASDLVPDARITVFADGSGGYPDIPGINATIGTTWGTLNAVPDWPVNEGVTAETWSLPGLFVKAGTHDPEITLARHDYAFDETQVFFADLAGIPADELVRLIDRNEEEIEAGGVDLLSYISPGDEHTVVEKDELYTEELNGVRLIDWLTALVRGETVTDEHCEDCEP